MRIAITQRVTNNTTYPECRDALSHEWALYLGNILPEAIVIPVPNLLHDVESWADELDLNGALFSNGNDWGESLERDKTEQRLFEYCREKKIPVFGVCRGLQAFNLFMGGGVCQDIAGASGYSHVGVEHAVSIAGEKFISFARGSEICVNSYHNQGIRDFEMAQCFFGFATANGNIIEGLHHKSEPILAIQWHPERSGPSADFNKTLIHRFFRFGTFWV